MANENLNTLCMDESNPMLNVVIRCKHGILLNLQTSWSKLNPGRRFWSFPCYGVCIFLSFIFGTFYFDNANVPIWIILEKLQNFSMAGQRRSESKINFYPSMIGE